MRRGRCRGQDQQAHLPARPEAGTEAHPDALRGERSHHPGGRHARPNRGPRAERRQAAHLRRDCHDSRMRLRIAPCGIR